MTEKIKYLKYSQLANAFGLQQAAINVAVKRDLLIPCVVDGKKMIDITNPTNKLWLKKQEDLGKYFDLNAIYKKPSEVKRQTNLKPVTHTTKQTPTTEETPDPEREELRKIQIETKKATLKRIQKAIELDEIKVAKQLGQLIPFDAVKGFFLYTVETFSKSYEQESKTIADLILSRLGATQEEFIEVRKELSKKVVEIKTDTVDQLLDGLDQIVEEYQEVRGRGESK